ncbi:MAG: adenosylmethionine decarboxylase [bacterium]
MKALAKHVVAEYYGCDPVLLDDPAYMEPVLAEAARVSNATVMNSCLHKFSPQGVSGVLILAESHLAVHTWPEYSYAAVEIFTCGDTTDPEAGHRYLVEELKPAHHELRVIERGDMDTAEHYHHGDTKVACIS